MSDSVMLVCAVFASLAFGVLMAYGVCQAMFGLLRMNAPKVSVESELPVAQPAGVVEG